MGKQINFFMSGKDELLFFKFIENTEDILLDYYGNPLNYYQLQEPIIYSETQKNHIISLFYITIPSAKIKKRESGALEQLDSEVIQFSRSVIKNQNQLWNGRMWLETKYYNDKRQAVTKPEWLIKKFDEYKKWITKNLKLNKDKDFYIGAEAYKMYKEQGFKMMNAPKVSIEFD